MFSKSSSKILLWLESAWESLSIHSSIILLSLIRASTHLYCADNCRLCKLNCTYLVAHQISIDLIYQRSEIFTVWFCFKIKLLGVFDLFGDANSSTLINKKILLILMALPNKLDCVEFLWSFFFFLWLSEHSKPCSLLLCLQLLLFLSEEVLLTQ